MGFAKGFSFGVCRVCHDLREQLLRVCGLGLRNAPSAKNRDKDGCSRGWINLNSQHPATPKKRIDHETDTDLKFLSLEALS